MKNTWICTIFILLTSVGCKVQRLIQAGLHDKALDLLTAKLIQRHGELNSREWKLLAYTFKSVIPVDLSYIEEKPLPQSVEELESVLALINTTEKRRQAVLPWIYALHLSDQDYLQYYRELNSRSVLIKQTIINRLTTDIQKYLEQARIGQHLAAREAYGTTEKLMQYQPSAEVLFWRQEARRLGQIFVLMAWQVQPDFVHHNFGENISLNNDFWTVFHNHREEQQLYDYTVLCQINVLENGRESCDVTSYNYCQTIIDGVEPIFNSSGQEVKDSSGNIQYQPRQVTVSATLIERIYHKHTRLSGTFEFFDHRQQNLLTSKTFSAMVHAESSEATYTGDQRALGPIQMSKLASIESLPGNNELMEQAKKHIYYQLKEHLSTLLR